MKPLEHDRKQRTRAFADTGWIVLWGGVAMLFAVVGVSSVFLADGVSQRRVATVLPPNGDVTTTASISPRAEDAIEVFPSSGGIEAAQARRQLQGEMEVLRREVAALKRTVSVLRERKDRLVADGSPGSSGIDETRVPRTKDDFNGRVDAAVEAIAGKPKPVETMPAPAQTQPARHEAPTRAAAPSAQEPVTESGIPETLRQPVRIVALPGTPAPEAVASIPEETAGGVPVDDAPAEARLSPAPPAGTISGAAGSRIERSDFGLDLGVFADAESAEARWAEIRDGDAALPPEIGIRQIEEPESGQIRLIAGPFANAADAAIACVQLAVRDMTCTPVLFPQDTVAARP
ncbi:SPOR domain-containing protein [Stappia sp.]|uniref:SPOR domain-containing protein n=1 Tax=Stappia sp. TaxID=1870903 RepID=UPI0032D95085